MMVSDQDIKPLRVFILHWNRPEECARTVRLFCGDPVISRITIIDNCSSPNNVDRLRAEVSKDTEILCASSNLGWGGGHNLGLRKWLAHETEEFCIVSAHDALPQSGCTNTLVTAMRRDPQLGMVCPQYEGPEVGVFTPIRGPRVVSFTQGQFGSVQSVGFLHGTLMLFRRRCLEQIGIFDERYFAYGDEMEISLRARRYGWKIGIVWGAVVINPGSWTRREHLAYLASRNSLLLAQQYGSHMAAVCRALCMLAHSFRMRFTWNTATDSLAFPKARDQAVKDYYLRRFGPPPAVL